MYRLDSWKFAKKSKKEIYVCIRVSSSDFNPPLIFTPESKNDFLKTLQSA